MLSRQGQKGQRSDLTTRSELQTYQSKCSKSNSFISLNLILLFYFTLKLCIYIKYNFYVHSCKYNNILLLMSVLRPVWNATHGLPIDLRNINRFILHRFFCDTLSSTCNRRKPRATCIFLYLYIYINIHYYTNIFICFIAPRNDFYYRNT